jgi:isopenicillin-N epimerase
MTFPEPSSYASHWMLDPRIVFLNQGSYGACPREVFDARVRQLEAAEAEPIDFLMHEAWRLLDRSREKLGALVNAPTADMVFVPNVTVAFATIMNNLKLEPGDEVLANTHEYPACLAILERATAAAGAKLIKPELPFPVGSEDEIVERLVEHVSDRTRYCLVSHVTSPSAMILPVRRIVSEMKSRGVETIVDGAHAPGFCPVDVEAIGPAFYIANCHKWLCSPRASGFMYVRGDLQAGFRPLALSVFTDGPREGRSFFHTEFDYVGTSDQSAAACVADAIEAVPGFIDGDWEAVRARNHNEIVYARKIICDLIGVEAPVPESMLGSMATIPLPEHEPGRALSLAARPTRYHDALQDRLLSLYSIQVPIWPVARGGGLAPKRFVRISCHLYNSAEQYVYLAEALAEELEYERELER